MITPSFSLTATERVLPKLALDFTTASLDPRVIFTRTTDATHPATYFDSTGNIASATNNQPRFDYDSITLACKGLLIEESRTNAVTYSQQFATAPWTKTGGTVTNNTTDLLSPDGANNATKFDISNTAQAVYYANTFSYSSGSTYTLSMYVKGSIFSLYFASGGLAQGAKVDFNLTNQTASVSLYGTAATVTYQILPCKNSWYRCVMTITLASTTAYYIQFGSTVTGALYLYGAQLEAGAFATSYIPTTTTALTRNADVATMTGTNFSDWFNASEGTFSIKADLFDAGSGHLAKNPFGQVYGTSTTTLYMGKRVAGGGETNFQFFVADSGTQAFIQAASVLSTSNVFYTGVSAYKANSFQAACATVLGTQDTSGTVPSGMTAFNLGSSGTETAYLNGHIAKVNYWPQRLTNAEVQANSK